MSSAQQAPALHRRGLYSLFNDPPGQTIPSNLKNASHATDQLTSPLVLLGFEMDGNDDYAPSQPYRVTHPPFGKPITFFPPSTKTTVTTGTAEGAPQTKIMALYLVLRPHSSPRVLCMHMPWSPSSWLDVLLPSPYLGLKAKSPLPQWHDP